MPAVAECCTAADVDISPGNQLLLRLSVLPLWRGGIYSKEMKNKSRSLRVVHLLMFTHLKERCCGNCNLDFLPSLERVVKVITKEMVLLKRLVDSHTLPANSRETVFPRTNPGRNSWGRPHYWLQLPDRGREGRDRLFPAVREEPVNRSCRKRDSLSDSGQTCKQASKEAVNSPCSEILEPWLDIALNNWAELAPSSVVVWNGDFTALLPYWRTALGSWRS